MRVAVTGANGNSGRYVVEALLEGGHEVLAVLRERAEYPYDTETLRIESLEHVGAHATALRRCDAVVHLARQYVNERDAVLTIDVAGTLKLLDVWEKGPFIYASSQTVYGVPKSDLHENHGFSPECWYDVGKIVCEYALREKFMFTIGAVPAVCLRLPLLFSTNECRNFNQWLQIMFDTCASGKTFLFESEEKLLTAGSSYLGGRDLGAAVVASLASPKPGAFNLASGFVTWHDLLHRMGSRIGVPPKIVVRSPAIPQSAAEFRVPQSRSNLVTELFDASYPALATRWEDIVDEYVDLELALRARN